MTQEHSFEGMPEPGPKFMAAVKLIGRTGAKEFSVRYSDDDKPIVWMALAGYQRTQGLVFEVGAGLTPERAVLRLCETVIDGGKCTHCERPTGFEPDSLDTMPANTMVCWYQWDPELAVFRRGCE